MQNYIIANREELDEFISRAHSEGDSLVSIKGEPPSNALYEDGELIVNPVNVAWKRLKTGDIIEIQYKQILNG